MRSSTRHAVACVPRHARSGCAVAAAPSPASPPPRRSPYLPTPPTRFGLPALTRRPRNPTEPLLAIAKATWVKVRSGQRRRNSTQRPREGPREAWRGDTSRTERAPAEATSTHQSSAVTTTGTTAPTQCSAE
eukprot:6428250-Prymnesium_polylepis.1